MKTFVLATISAALLALGGVAHAAQITSPNVTGAASSDRAECIVVNAGDNTVPVTLKLMNESGALEFSYNCGALGPGQFCSINRPAAGIVGYRCIATGGSMGHIRGTIILLEEQLDSYGITRLRAIRSAPME